MENKNIHHIVLTVNNVKKSTAFYIEGIKKML